MTLAKLLNSNTSQPTIHFNKKKQSKCGQSSLKNRQSQYLQIRIEGAIRLGACSPEAGEGQECIGKRGAVETGVDGKCEKFMAQVLKAESKIYGNVKMSCMVICLEKQ